MFMVPKQFRLLYMSAVHCVCTEHPKCFLASWREEERTAAGSECHIGHQGEKPADGLRTNCSIVLANTAFSIFIIQILHVSGSGVSQAVQNTCQSETQTLLNRHYPCIARINALSKHKLRLRIDMMQLI